MRIKKCSKYKNKLLVTKTVVSWHWQNQPVKILDVAPRFGQEELCCSNNTPSIWRVREKRRTEEENTAPKGLARASLSLSSWNVDVGFVHMMVLMRAFKNQFSFESCPLRRPVECCWIRLSFAFQSKVRWGNVDFTLKDTRISCWARVETRRKNVWFSKQIETRMMAQ